MKRVKLFALIVLVAGLSCSKKKYPPDFVGGNEPLFYLKVNVDNVPVTLKAGVDNYYMYAAYKQDGDGLYGFTASLKQANCEVCPKSLQIKINDYMIRSMGESVNADVALKAQKYPLQDGNGSGYAVQFQSNYNKTPQTYTWDFGDGAVSTESDPLHIFKKADDYKVCLGIKGDNSCVGNVCNSQRIDDNSLITSVVVGSSLNNTIGFNQMTSGGKAPYTYFWSFGDGKTGTGANPSHTYAIPGSYPVTLRVTDADNKTVTANYNASTKSDGSSCTANYRIMSVNRVSAAMSGVVISWVDENNVVYASNTLNQPASSFFEITSVENFDNNELGQLTKKLHVKFKCNVYNGTKGILMESDDAVICVAYK